MMYSGKMAFAIKVNGKILREQAETVFLPFGSEYSLLIKNLNTRRALVRIWIDGQEIVDDGLVVNANSSVDLERFVRRGELQGGQRFKFIERTAKVEENRGIGLEDGLIRVEFEFEREYYFTTTITPNYWHQPTFYGGLTNIAGSTGESLLRSSSVSGSLSDTATFASAGTASASVGQASAEPVVLMNMVAKNDAGITVGGSLSSQKFTTVSFTGDGVKSVMVLKMKGEVAEQKVEEPVTVKTKQKCPTCGHTNKAKAKFCTECGTGLEMWPGAKATHSRFQIGDWVVCKGYRHMVKSVRFTEDKVTYGLAFGTNLDGDVIEYPSEDVYPAHTEHAKV